MSILLIHIFSTNYYNLWQKEEREKVTQKKTNEALDEIRKSLQSLTAIVTTNLKPPAVPEMDNSLNAIGDPLSSRLDATDAKLDSIKKEVEALKNSLSKVRCSISFITLIISGI